MLIDFQNTLLSCTTGLNSNKILPLAAAETPSAELDLFVKNTIKDVLAQSGCLDDAQMVYDPKHPIVSSSANATWVFNVNFTPNYFHTTTSPYLSTDSERIYYYIFCARGGNVGSSWGAMINQGFHTTGYELRKILMHDSVSSIRSIKAMSTPANEESATLAYSKMCFEAYFVGEPDNFQIYFSIAPTTPVTVTKNGKTYSHFCLSEANGSYNGIIGGVQIIACEDNGTPTSQALNVSGAHGSMETVGLYTASQVGDNLMVIVPKNQPIRFDKIFDTASFGKDKWVLTQQSFDLIKHA